MCLGGWRGGLREVLVMLCTGKDGGLVVRLRTYHLVFESFLSIEHGTASFV